MSHQGRPASLTARQRERRDERKMLCGNGTLTRHASGLKSCLDFRHGKRWLRVCRYLSMAIHAGVFLRVCVLKGRSQQRPSITGTELVRPSAFLSGRIRLAPSSGMGEPCVSPRGSLRGSRPGVASDLRGKVPVKV